jgi:hypothetical protein
MNPRAEAYRIQRAIHGFLDIEVYDDLTLEMSKHAKSAIEKLIIAILQKDLKDARD